MPHFPLPVTNGVKVMNLGVLGNAKKRERPEDAETPNGKNNGMDD